MTAVALAATAAVPAAAQTGTIQTPVDQQELSESLAEATAATGTCFGWEVTGDVGDGPSPEVGSNLGVGVPAAGRAGACPRGTLVVEADVSYSCDSCESEDSASWTVASTVPGLSGDEATDTVDALADVDDGDLLGDDDDRALRNLVAALPLALDRTVPVEREAAAARGPDAPDDVGGSDGLRGLVGALVFAVIMLLAGVVTALVGVVVLRARRRGPGPGPPAGGSRAGGPATGGPAGPPRGRTGRGAPASGAGWPGPEAGPGPASRPGPTGPAPSPGGARPPWTS